MFKSYCTVDLLPLGSYDERILFPYDLALGNRLLRDETFPFFPIKIFDLDGCRPSGVSKYLTSMVVVHLEMSRPSTSANDGNTCAALEKSRPRPRVVPVADSSACLCEGTVRVQTFQDSSQTFFAHSPQGVLGK